MTCWCSVRGRGRTALTAVAALAACVSLTSSVDAGVVGYYNPTSSSGSSVNSFAFTPAAFSFTAGTSDSLTQFRLMTNNAPADRDVTLKLYQFTGALNGNFNYSTATPVAQWQFNDDPLSGGIATFNRFDLTTNLVGGSAAVIAGQQYVLTFAPSLSVGLTRDSGTQYGTDGWAPYGSPDTSTPPVNTGSYLRSGTTGSNWTDYNFQWEVTFGATAVPGAGVAGLSVVGLAGLRRRRR